MVVPQSIRDPRQGSTQVNLYSGLPVISPGNPTPPQPILLCSNAPYPWLSIFLSTKAKTLPWAAAHIGIPALERCLAHSRCLMNTGDYVGVRGRETGCYWMAWLRIGYAGGLPGSHRSGAGVEE